MTRARAEVAEKVAAMPPESGAVVGALSCSRMNRLQRRRMCSLGVVSTTRRRTVYRDVFVSRCSAARHTSWGLTRLVGTLCICLCIVHVIIV